VASGLRPRDIVRGHPLGERDAMRYRLNINNRSHEIDTPPGVTLLSALRDDLGFTGTRYGCGHGACGACVVLVDGAAQPACMLSVDDVTNKRVVTIEGLAHDGGLHPVQRAFLDEDALQCGYCTSGMVIAAVALLGRVPHPTDENIREALAPHLCRCGVYGRVLRAVRKAAQ
jgi:aerobic-type carbon monoxide dehydrogenase small subunit (CoxS/CutS family)